MNGFPDEAAIASVAERVQGNVDGVFLGVRCVYSDRIPCVVRYTI